MTTTWVAAILLICIAAHGAAAARWRAAARALAHANSAAAQAVRLAAVSTVLQWVVALICLGAAGIGFAELEVAASLVATGLGASALRLTAWRAPEPPTSA